MNPMRAGPEPPCAPLTPDPLRAPHRGLIEGHYMAKPVTLVTFVLPSTLRHWAAGQTEVKVFAVAAAGEEVPTLGSALDGLRRVRPELEQRLRDEYGDIRRHISMFVCGEHAGRLGGLDCALPPAAEIYILPALLSPVR
jgi:molybdopterin synthase sulfur carrier subunit